ncbi:hypothetical protein [Methylocystis heyeri]|uniref:Uncharacterized protein n=1 Tax=Methylocystis heyeri TaxID=391905 RepID=A0A6B8KES7_9HYPH|nr:hypothetical protein [Methylocystis heyeri]QGM46122.1 hypothetical protein H2LOC_010685 [Methylocystis heyeri]
MSDDYPTFERTLDSARMQLNGALDGVLKLELYWVLKEFFDRTWVWRTRITKPVYQQNCGPHYKPIELIPDQYPAQIISLISARIVGADKSRLVHIPATLELPDRVYVHEWAPIASWSQPLGSPVNIEFEVILSVTDPTADDGITYCPHWVEQRHGDTIMHGLLYRMMAQVQKPYSNLAGAQFHGTKFRAGCAYAKNEKQHGNIRGGQAWAFPQTFRTRRRGF